MAHPYLALRPIRNGLVSHYVVAGSKNPLPLGMGSVKKENKLLNEFIISIPTAIKKYFLIALFLNIFNFLYLKKQKIFS